METKLKAYFPLIRERNDILKEIDGNENLSKRFRSWTEDRQKEFLDFCTGVKGVKMMYDAFFKEVMSPETAPELLEEFLSLVLKKEVRIFCVLPNDSTRIADESSLLITDIVVQLEDGSLANVEVQRIGYLFPGERCACYSADLLLRQYRRVRGEKQKKFSYKDIKTVYTIVLFEKSPKVFRAFPGTFLHRFEQHSDTGLELELLQKYVFVPLDIFRRKMHNEAVREKLEAWLMFFSTDDPSDMIRLMEAYPEFRSLYETIYRICRNMEKIMGIFSEELLWLDRNTTQYMMDEMQDEIDKMQGRISGMKETIDGMQGTIDGMQGTIDEQDAVIKQQQLQLEQERRLRNRKRIRQMKKMTEKGISEEECAELLDEDPDLIQKICQVLLEYPEEDEEALCSRLEQIVPAYKRGDYAEE